MHPDDKNLFSFDVVAPIKQIEPRLPIAPHCSIAVILPHPEPVDHETGLLLSGAAGNMLLRALRTLGVDVGECYFDFLSTNAALAPKIRAVKGRATVTPSFERDDIVRDNLLRYVPNIVLLVGDAAVSWWFGTTAKAEHWRGSLVNGPVNGLFASQPALVIEHPSQIFMDWGGRFPLFRYDMQKLGLRWRSRDWTQPAHNFNLYVTPGDSERLLAEITNIETPVAMDIEGYVTGMSCVSFARDSRTAFIVPLSSFDAAGKRRALRAIARFLASSTPKILQNSLYDNFVLSFSYRMPIRNVIWDTMLGGWELDPELPKGLATQTSIYTMWPYYKHLRLEPSSREYWRYCCLDSAITYEIYEYQRAHLSGSSLAHFQFNMELLAPLLYMELRGIVYDRSAATEIARDAGAEMTTHEHAMLKCLRATWRQHGARGPEPVMFNPASPTQLADVLYKRLGYPPQHPKEGREYDRTRVTTNVDALLNLRVLYGGEQHAILDHLLAWRKLSRFMQAAKIMSDGDGRARCAYNVVGTETGRLACYESPTHSGANLTTITKKLRRLYRADDEHWFFQCDLSGADGWTVAAHCAALGDDTMLNDYYAKRKPAKIIALMYLIQNSVAPALSRLGPDVTKLAADTKLHEALISLIVAHGATLARWSHDVLDRALDHVTEEGPWGWLYFTAKVVQHGTNYGLGKDKMAGQILRTSYKNKGTPVVVSPFDCLALQHLYLARYPGVRRWQEAVKRAVQTVGKLPCASGHIRTFNGRSTDHSTVAAAWSHEPQANTTYATNTALLRLWHDEENRVMKRVARTSSYRFENTGRPFRIEPLHHVHDALCGQFRRDDVEWAVERIPRYFDNPIVVAGHRFVIPFEGAYGPSWGELGPRYGGGNIG